MKKVKTTAITIILGALGSALFEFVFKNLLTGLMHKISMLYLSFIDNSFYRRLPISISSPSAQTFIFFILGIVLFIAFPLDFFKFLFHWHSTEKFDSIVHSAFKICYILIFSYTFLVTSIAYLTSRNTLINIEIVAPYISDVKYKQLKSDFYQIDSKEDFDTLTCVINEIATQHDLHLQEIH